MAALVGFPTGEATQDELKIKLALLSPQYWNWETMFFDYVSCCHHCV